MWIEPLLDWVPTLIEDWAHTLIEPFCHAWVFLVCLREFFEGSFEHWVKFIIFAWCLPMFFSKKIGYAFSLVLLGIFVDLLWYCIASEKWCASSRRAIQLVVLLPFHLFFWCSPQLDCDIERDDDSDEGRMGNMSFTNHKCSLQIRPL